jgi:hypothetical protein
MERVNTSGLYAFFLISLCSLKPYFSLGKRNCFGVDGNYFCDNKNEGIVFPIGKRLILNFFTSLTDGHFS